MNKTYKLTALWMMCLMLLSSLSFTACDDGDDENTNQYTGGINLKVFGPCPVARGGVLRFLGSGMDQVTGVIIPGCDEITDIEVVSNEEIRVTVPQTAEVGLVRLNTPKGEIITKTEITYSEPISLESISPASIKPGNVLTISGEYLNLIKEVIFAEDVVVTSFVSQSRKEIKVTVPAEAQTGKIIISDGAEIPNWIYSDVELNVILPSVAEVSDLTEKKPGDVITIEGSNFDLITKVNMPNGDEVEYTIADNKLTFTLPENISDGSIVAIPASGVEVVIATIGVAIPSEVVAEPATELRAGNVITLTGKNMELITNITFPGVAEAVALDAQTETEVKVTKPAAAISGVMQLNTNSGVSIPVAIVTQKPEFESFASDAVALASQVTIQGKNMDLVSKVTFTGGAEVAEFTATETEVILTMPSMQVETGVLTLTMANGETVETTTLTINAPEACYIPELPGEDVELKGGEVWVVDVENADKLTGVQIDGQDVDFLLNGKTLYINVPQLANANSIVKLISENGELEYAVPFIPATNIEIVIFNTLTDIGSWDEPRVYIPASEFEREIPSNAKLKIYFIQKDAWGQIQINDGNWSNTGITFPELPDDDGNPSCYLTTNNAGGKDVTEKEITLTPELVERFRTNNGIIIQGSDWIVSKISITYEISLESTIWENEFACAGWNGNQDLAWGGFDWTTIKAGSIIRFYYTKAIGWGCISLRHGDSWGGLPSPIPGQYDLPDDVTEGVVEVELPQNVLDDLLTYSGMVITGDNYTLKRITIE